MRVVVVGAGIAGASAAFTLRSRLGSSVELVVLDRAPRVGGRIDDRDIGGLRVETGATLFHSSNRLIVGHAQRLGLETIDLSAGRQTFGIWQGKAFAIRSSGRASADRLRLLARYRRSLLRASRLVREMVSRLEAVYDLLEAGAVWESPAALVADLGLAAALSRARRRCVSPARPFGSLRRRGC